MRFGGKLLGLPGDLSPIVMLYNQDLFDQFGVAYPRDDWTCDDFLATCKALTRDTNGDGETDVFAFMNIPGTKEDQARPHYNRWPAWVWMNGGEILSPDGKRCVMDSPASIEGMQFFADLSLRHRVSPMPGEHMGRTAQELFMGSQLGLIAESRYVYKKFLPGKGRRGLPFRWDCAPMPKGKQRATTFIWGGNCMLKTTRYPEECWKFLKYISGPEGAAINVAGGNALPVYRAVAEAEVAHPQNPATPKHDRCFLDAIDYGRIAPCPAQYAEFIEAMDAFDDAFLGRTSVADACRQFTRNANEALKIEVI